MYTLEQLREKRIWIKCTSPHQGQLLGKYYNLEGDSDTWEKFDFQKEKEFCVYIANKNDQYGGWDDLDYIGDAPIIDFSETFLTNNQYEIY